MQWIHWKWFFVQPDLHWQEPHHLPHPSKTQMDRKCMIGTNWMTSYLKMSHISESKFMTHKAFIRKIESKLGGPGYQIAKHKRSRLYRRHFETINGRSFWKGGIWWSSYILIWMNQFVSRLGLFWRTVQTYRTLSNRPIWSLELFILELKPWKKGLRIQKWAVLEAFGWNQLLNDLLWAFCKWPTFNWPDF